MLGESTLMFTAPCTAVSSFVAFLSFNQLSPCFTTGYYPGSDPSRPPPPLQKQQIGRQPPHYGPPRIGEVDGGSGGGQSFGTIPGPPQQQYGTGIGQQWPGGAYPARGGQPSQQHQGGIRSVDGYPLAQQQRQVSITVIE